MKSTEEEDTFINSKIPEQKRVSSTQIYEDIKRAIKLFFKILIVLFFTYALYKIFGAWVFYSILISILWFYMLYRKLIKVPGKKFLEIDIDNGIISPVFIPYQKLKDFKMLGFSTKYKTHFSNIEVVKKIDEDNKRIIGFWFHKADSIFFLARWQAFTYLADNFKKWLDRNAKYCVDARVEAYKNTGEYMEMYDKIFKELPGEIEIEVMEHE